MKNLLKKSALFTVDFIAAPVHIGLQLGSNLLQLGADGVAMGEGYLTEKIDGTQDRELVANARVNHTQKRFKQTADALHHAKQKLEQSIDAANDKMKDIKQSMRREPAIDGVVHSVEIVPVEHYDVCGGQWRTKQ